MPERKAKMGTLLRWLADWWVAQNRKKRGAR